MTEQQKIEKRLATAATRSNEAREKFEQEIRDARTAGLSLRVIASASGVSHEWIRRLASSSAKTKTAA